MPKNSAQSITIRQPTRTELSAVRTLRHEELNGDQPLAAPLAPAAGDLAPAAIHMAAFEGTRLVSAVRADPQPEDPTVYVISRMVTRAGYRGQGIGRRVLAAVEAEAIKCGAKGLILFARTTATGFYAKAGYLNTHVPHETHLIMVKQV